MYNINESFTVWGTRINDDTTVPIDYFATFYQARVYMDRINLVSNNWFVHTFITPPLISFDNVFESIAYYLESLLSLELNK